MIWATGYRRHYPWLRVRGACGQDGEIVQRHGVTPVPGLYTIGIRFQSRRTSHFIGGAGQDAAELAEVIAGATPRRAEIRRRLSPKALPHHRVRRRGPLQSVRRVGFHGAWERGPVVRLSSPIP